MNEVSFSRKVKEVHFGAWVFDPKTQTISDGDVERELEPLLFKLLSYFIINNDQVITRQNLVDDVWCQNYVDDNAINRAISELRKILKSDKQRGIVLKTHYRKGYSFVFEPIIIYHDQLSSETQHTSPDTPFTPHQTDTSIKATGKSQRAKSIKAASFIAGALALVLLGSQFTPIVDSQPDVVEKSIEESVLSWIEGRYTLLNLSPDKRQLLFAFIPSEGQNYTLVVKDLNTGYEKRLGEEQVNYFPVGWSVDSSTVYYRIVKDDTCQVWRLNADFNSSSEYLFPCEPAGLSGIGVDNNHFIYSKRGYRNKDELAALTSRNLVSGEEYQITSPNLNSYGDNLLAYIPEKETIIFERLQLDTSELYMTDLDGGNQVKLYETQNRIWALNYDRSKNMLVWLDTVESKVYGYSLTEKRLTNVTKLLGNINYASYQSIGLDEFLTVSYPFLQDIYTYDVTSGQLTEKVKSPHEDVYALDVQDHTILLRRVGNKLAIKKIDSDGQTSQLGLPNGRYTAISYDKEQNRLLVQYQNKIEIYDYESLSLIASVAVDGIIISSEFLFNNRIGYVVLDEQKVRSRAYIYSLEDSKETKLPMVNLRWVGQLNDYQYVTLSSDDKVLLYDAKKGEVSVTVNLPKALYKHSEAIGNGLYYHSDGKSIYRVDFYAEEPVTEIYSVDASKFVIQNLRISETSGQLLLDILEVRQNQLLKVKVQD
ncbi:winged helix-turn-helix domain-containing protein [Pseudoalteromonas sp. T1lg23B]|uniref:winged helix-turn-helix domain-containing protein n=1 Tax=Pseudoalteromonas sp. T1lg23B TaxID=2077097 RepID=UPI001F2CAF60|nr:winged helix-turn-helix domain-containing protein [Pseudoalteromonas sp. T1lg23B]